MPRVAASGVSRRSRFDAMAVSLKRDGKGPCWILSHKRCGFTESVFLTEGELEELRRMLNGEEKGC